MAETSGSTKYHLRILVQPSKPGSSDWEAAVYLGGACFAKDITLSDPFTTAEKEECSWYLEDYLSKSPFEKARADIVTESLNSYADSLFNQLRLSRVWRRLSVPTSPRKKILEIDIFEANEASNAISSDTIHRLHWEVLEHPRLWKNVIVQTTVRRVIPQKETSSLSINQIESWSEGVPAVNILLVISRMLVRKGQVEVDPDLVRHSLQTLKRDLETRGAPFRLNIEIVRPGSFQALKKHLDKRARCPNNSDIHIVHFDVHGQVGLRGKDGTRRLPTTPFLCFQSEIRQGELAPTRAGSVAELLQKHKIRIVVLNACESAIANKGDEANVARTFTKAGVQNVLAMAYKVHSTSCTAFMRCFYQSLIADGKPFSLAVREAREHLRASPNRDARFALIRPLEDWIVPVVYARGKDVELHVSTIPNSSLLQDDSFSMVSLDIPQEPPPTPLVGRGIDVLRFETQFLASNVFGLCGPAGVGKTAFIRHLVRSWKDTRLYDNILHLDCGKVQRDGIDTAVFLQHFLCGSNQNSSIPDLTGPKQDEYRSLISVLGDKIRVVVLDNLEASHSDVDEMNEHGRWPESTRSAVIALINDILNTGSKEEDESVSFILVGRSDDEDWWTKHFPDLPKINRYRLNGLSLPDAIEYAHILLGKYGLDMSKWRHVDEDVLSQVLNLLQCNPLAILTILETAASQEHPWRELFEKILFHQYLCLEPIASDKLSFITRDMISATIDGPRKAVYVNVFSGLALYWHQGPSQDVLKTLVGRSQEHQFTTALEFGVDRGYFSLDARGYVENIHPLFTIIGRSIFAAAPLILCRPLQWLLIADEDSEEDLSVPWFFSTFFRGIDSRELAETIKQTGLAGRFREFEKFLRPAFYNILTCLRLCSLGKELICVDRWPEALQMYANAGIWFLSVDELKMMVKYHEILLRRFISRRPDVIEVWILVLMIDIGNFLTSSHLVLSSLPTRRAKELSILTFDLIDNTEDELRKNRDVILAISVSIMNRDFADFSQGSKTMADTEIFRNVILSSGKGVTEEELASVTWSQVESALPAAQTRGQEMENFIQEGNLQAQFSELRKKVQDGVAPRDPVDFGMALSRISLNAQQNDPFMDWTGVKKGLDPVSRRAELDNSLGVRNRAEAIKHYKALLTLALKKWDMEEVIEIQKSLVEIYQTDEGFAEDLNAVLEMKKNFESFYQLLKLSNSVADVGEVPVTNRLLSEDIKRLEIMGSEYGLMPWALESLFQSAQRTEVRSILESGVERPKKNLMDSLDEWRQQAAKPGGLETVMELGAQFTRLFQRHRRALNEGDFETAIQTFDKVIEIDKPEILPGTPFLNVPEYKQMLVSCRDFSNAMSTISDVVDEGHLADAIAMAEALLQKYDDGNFPDLLEDLARSLRCSLCNLLWQQSESAWKKAFDVNEYAQALGEIILLRGIESSDFFADPVDTNFGSFSARDFTDWNHLRTLHRHFHHTGRPHLALKTVSYVLKRYEPSEHAPTLPTLTPENLERERCFKWFYEAMLQRKRCLQLIAEQDYDAAVPLLNVIVGDVRDAPEKLREFVPKQLLCELDNEQKKFNLAALVISIVSIAASGM